MPRFHFHSEGDRICMDLTGAELPDMAAAREEAVRRTGQELTAHAAEAVRERNWRMLVACEDGGVRFSVEVSTADGPDIAPRPGAPAPARLRTAR